MPPVVEVRGLRKKFDKQVAVDGISFQILEGEIFGLLGPNGAGKTTTIQMLLNVMTPDAGEIRIFGKQFATHSEDILRQMNFSSSYVSLPWNMTVSENLRFFSRLYGVKNPGQRIDELLNVFGLTEHRNTLTGKLSSGEHTRLMLAKALINRPKLLLLDEPTASLDPDIADRTRVILKKLAKDERVTMLYTSHNMSEVEFMCKRVAFLHHGKILTEGTPVEVSAKYGKQNLEDLFLHFVREAP